MHEPPGLDLLGAGGPDPERVIGDQTQFNHRRVKAAGNCAGDESGSGASGQAAAGPENAVRLPGDSGAVAEMLGHGEGGFGERGGDEDVVRRGEVRRRGVFRGGGGRRRRRRRVVDEYSEGREEGDVGTDSGGSRQHDAGGFGKVADQGSLRLSWHFCLFTTIERTASLLIILFYFKKKSMLNLYYDHV